MTAAPAPAKARAAGLGPRSLIGSPKPRIAPPVPARSDVPGLIAVAESAGIRLMPWQETAGRYLTATTKDDRLLYREVAIVVARQNGKTALMKPHIIRKLRAGRRVLHIAQTRELPREMFGLIADALSQEPELFAKRRGKTIWPRYGSGQEEIILANGGSYRIAASNRGGARGKSVDDLIIDETREMVDWDIISAAEPTMTMSDDPQTVYLSNMGTEESVVLNAIRERGIGGSDPGLAYLEWSAAPGRAADDREGWAEANPAIGHFPQVLRELERSYTARKADGKMAIFEIERLCRAQPSVRAALVDAKRWSDAGLPSLPVPVRPHMAVSMDPLGTRASAVIAWRQADGTVALRQVLEGTGTPIDTEKLGAALRGIALQHKVLGVGFDPMTDAALKRFFRRPLPITGQAFANASARFVAAVDGGTLRWTDSAAVTEDLSWTTRKAADGDKGAFEAVRGDDDRPITAALAAIRAVWLASTAPDPAKPATFRSW